MNELDAAAVESHAQHWQGVVNWTIPGAPSEGGFVTFGGVATVSLHGDSLGQVTVSGSQLSPAESHKFAKSITNASNFALSLGA